MLNSIDINLLPWRSLQQEKKQDKCIAAIIFAISFTLIIGAVTCYYYSYLIDEKIKKNIFLASYIEKILRLEDDVTELMNKLHTFQSILTEQRHTLIFFEGMARVAPEKLYLIKIVRQNDELLLTGYSESMQPLAEFMTKLMDLNVLEQPDLNIFDIKKDNYFEISTQWYSKE